MRLIWLSLASLTAAGPEACINSFTEVASNAVARSVFTHCIDADPNAERHTNEDIDISDPLTTVRKYCPLDISTKMFHSAFYEILEAGWATPTNLASPSRYNAITKVSTLCKKNQMNHEARRQLGELLASIYRDHLREKMHCLSMEDRKAAIEDMETTLYKVRNIIGSIRYSELLYLKNTKTPKVTLEIDSRMLELDLKKSGAGEGTAADHLRILMDKPSVVYMSLATGAPNSALVVNEDNEDIDMNLFYRSVLKDTTPGTVIFLVTGSEFPKENTELVNVIAGNAQNKNVKINVILLDPKYVSDESKIMYQSLALVTGGLLYETARRQASQLIPIIESRFQPDQVTIVRNQRIPTQERGAYIDVPVDSTMSELLFELYCPQLTKLQIFNPRYRSQRDIQTLVQTGNNYLYSIKNVEPGNWQAVVECKTDFYIEIRGQSPVDFFFTFASSDNNFKPTSPFGLNPRTVSSQIANDDDKKYLLVHSLGVENVELQSVQFKQEDAPYNHEKVLPLYLVESLVSAFPMPEDDSVDETVMEEQSSSLQMARIEGIDQSGFPVLRTHVLFPAKLLLITDLEHTDFLPGSETNVTIRITNAYKEIDVTAADVENWVTAISPTKTGKSYYTDVTITIKPPTSVEQGKMSTVTLIAESAETKQLLGSRTFEVAAGQRARPTIESLHIDTNINNKMAVTSVKSNIRNDHPEPREATFDALIPPNALITGLRLYVNGEVFSSEIQPAKAVEDKGNKKSPITITPSPAELHPHDHGVGGNPKGLNAAHILQRDAHRYEIKMNIDSWDNVTFELTYEELLERSQDRYQHWVSIAPSQVVKDLTTTVNVNDLGGIKWIRAYPVQSGTESFRTGSNADIKWNRGDVDATISYKPSSEDQQKFSQDGITGRMVVVYDTNHQQACDAMIQNNFFVQTCLPPKILLKSNANDGLAPYHVVFAIDKSGSMWGTKLDQTKEAFRSMISSLDREAKFSILAFNYATQPWRNRLVKASPYNVEEARGFISRISAGGGTNMHAALLDAIELCNSERGSSAIPCMILFMTDGTPTVGVTEDSRILNDITKSRSGGKANVAINVIGFGAGISYSFLSRLAATNNGIARQIFEDTDAAFQMQGFFEEVKKFTDTRRTMKSIEFMYQGDFIDSDSTTYDRFNAAQIGNGQEFTFAGKIKEKVLGTFKTIDSSLKIVDPTGEERIIEQRYEVNQIAMPDISLKNAFGKKEKSFESHWNLAERIYRLQIIKQLTRERHMAHGAEEYNEITRKLIDISTGSQGPSYLSPVMSMSVAKPIIGSRSRRSSDSFEDFDLNQKTQVSHVVQYEYRKLWWKNQVPDKSAKTFEISAEQLVGSIEGNPATFQVSLKNFPEPACFDISARPGTEFNILKDESLGLTVTGKTATNADEKLYFDQIRIRLTDGTTLIALGGQQILMQNEDKSLSAFESDKVKNFGDWQVRCTGGSCYLQFKSLVQIRLVSNSDSAGFEVAHFESSSSTRLSGLLGQFITQDLILASDGKSVTVGEDNEIPVSHYEYEIGKFCFYTDDYTMKLLGRRYYDYIY